MGARVSGTGKDTSAHVAIGGTLTSMASVSRAREHADSPQAVSVAPTIVRSLTGRTVRAVGITYAVKWRDPDGRSYVGRLELGPRDLRLEGRGVEEPVVARQLRLDGLRLVGTGSGGVDRLDGRPTLVVEDRSGRYLIAGAAVSAGVVQELVERLSELRASATDAR